MEPELVEQSNTSWQRRNAFRAAIIIAAILLMANLSALSAGGKARDHHTGGEP